MNVAGGIANSKGKLTKVSSNVSETKYNSFDILGRVLSHQQITDGQTYSTAYAYNLSGALIEETYPSGRVVKNTLDADGDLAMIQSSKSNVQGLKLYANSFNYTAAGAVSSMRLEDWGQACNGAIVADLYSFVRVSSSLSQAWSSSIGVWRRRGGG